MSENGPHAIGNPDVSARQDLQFDLQRRIDRVDNDGVNANGEPLDEHAIRTRLLRIPARVETV